MSPTSYQTAPPRTGQDSREVPGHQLLASEPSQARAEHNTTTAPKVGGVFGRDYWDHRAETWSVDVSAFEPADDAYGTVLFDAIPLDDGERVLDIGCGPGLTTIELAERVAPDGSVVGVDISPAMLTQARHLVEAAVAGGRIAPGRVELVAGDVQTAALGRDFDAAFSRFGVMFFGDPRAAFTNIAASLRPGAPLGFVAWGSIDDNPWATVPVAAAGGVLDVPELAFPSDGPGPFSLGDPAATAELLAGAGFAPPTIIDLDRPRRLSHDGSRVEMGLWLRKSPVGGAFAQADEATKAAAIDAAMASVERFRESGTHGGWALPALARVFATHRT